jgi:hypothetical protein
MWLPGSAAEPVARGLRRCRGRSYLGPTDAADLWLSAPSPTRARWGCGRRFRSRLGHGRRRSRLGHRRRFSSRLSRGPRTVLRFADGLRLVHRRSAAVAHPYRRRPRRRRTARARSRVTATRSEICFRSRTSPDARCARFGQGLGSSASATRRHRVRQVVGRPRRHRPPIFATHPYRRRPGHGRAARRSRRLIAGWGRLAQTSRRTAVPSSSPPPCEIGRVGDRRLQVLGRAGRQSNWRPSVTHPYRRCARRGCPPRPGRRLSPRRGRLAQDCGWRVRPRWLHRPGTRPHPLQAGPGSRARLLSPGARLLSPGALPCRPGTRPLSVRARPHSLKARPDRLQARPHLFQIRLHQVRGRLHPRGRRRGSPRECVISTGPDIGPATSGRPGSGIRNTAASGLLATGGGRWCASWLG